MCELSIRFLFLSEIPLTIAFTLLAFAFARLEFRMVPVLLIGTVEALLEFFVRKYPFPGFNVVTNVPLLVASLAVMLYIYWRGDIFRLVTASFLACAILLLLELITTFVALRLWPGYLENAGQNDLLFALGSYPCTTVTLGLAFYINSRNRRL